MLKDIEVTRFFKGVLKSLNSISVSLKTIADKRESRKGGMMKKEDRLGGDDLHCIIVRVPKAAVALSFTATIIGDDMEKHEAEYTLKPSELRRARQDFVEQVGDDDFDAVFSLTEKGRGDV